MPNPPAAHPKLSYHELPLQSIQTTFSVIKHIFQTSTPFYKLERIRWSGQAAKLATSAVCEYSITPVNIYKALDRWLIARRKQALICSSYSLQRHLQAPVYWVLVQKTMAGFLHGAGVFFVTFRQGSCPDNMHGGWSKCKGEVLIGVSPTGKRLDWQARTPQTCTWLCSSIWWGFGECVCFKRAFDKLGQQRL